MVVGIIVALFVTALIYALATLIVRKSPPPPEFIWIIWLVAVLLIVLVWWNRVLEPLIGPLP
jgi:hypothetical protein